MTVPASSLKFDRWSSIPRGNGPCRVTTTSAPHSDSATRTGAAALLVNPKRWAICGHRPGMLARSSARAARPVRHTRQAEPSPDPGARIPTSKLSGAPASASITVDPSGSNLSTMPKSTPASHEASRARASSTSGTGASRAASSASRRRAACSSASACTSVLACTSASAAPTSSVNCCRRCSVPAGSGEVPEVAVSIPHTSPATRIAAATDALNPNRTASSASRSRV